MAKCQSCLQRPSTKPSTLNKWQDAFFGFNLDGKHYAWLDLPSAKTVKPGEIQSIFVIPQGDLCPIEALQNLACVVPARPKDLLFSWQDKSEDIHPMVKSMAINHINSILRAHGWGMAFGHSFHIGGASFYLTQKINPEIICLASHWRSLAYKAYICTFKQIVSCHLSNMLDHQS